MNVFDDGLSKLREGNDRFVKGKFLFSCRDDATRRKLAANGQHPMAVVISCSDSRADPAIVFDCGLGDLFCIRTAGNVVGKVEIESIRYAVDALQVRLVVVMGHTVCGAVGLALDQFKKPVKPEVPESVLVSSIMPACKKAHEELPEAPGDAVYRRAACLHVLNVLETLDAAGFPDDVRLAGALYDIESGVVSWL